MIDFRTASGRRINLERPRGEDIEIVDIARGLSNCCRFAGQLPRFYSVAQHSVSVAELLDPPLRLLGLIHDASEAYMGDLSRNLKHHPLLEGYRALEKVLQATIERRFGVRATPERDRVMMKRADDLVAMLERVELREQKKWAGVDDVRRLLADGYVSADEFALAPLLPRVTTLGGCWSPMQAERRFLAAFERYRNLA